MLMRLAEYVRKGQWSVRLLVMEIAKAIDWFGEMTCMTYICSRPRLLGVFIKPVKSSTRASGAYSADRLQTVMLSRQQDSIIE